MSKYSDHEHYSGDLSSSVKSLYCGCSKHNFFPVVVSIPNVMMSYVDEDGPNISEDWLSEVEGKMISVLSPIVSIVCSLVSSFSLKIKKFRVKVNNVKIWKD